jgi:CheY-like chemotaxis protein
MTLVRTVRKMIQPPRFGENEHKNRTAATLNVVLWALIGTGAFVAIFDPGIGRNLGLAVATTGVILLVLMHQGYVKVSGALLSLFLLFVPTAAIYVDGTIRTSAPAIYIVAIIIAGLLVNSTAMIMATVLAILILLALARAELMQLLPNTTFEVSGAQNMSTWAVFAAVIAMTSVLLLLALRSVARALTRARSNEAELAKSNQALQAVQNALEDKIEERTRKAEQARQEAEATRQSLEVQMWQITGQAQLNQLLRGQQDIAGLARNVIRHLCAYTEAVMGAFFIRDGDEFVLLANYAYTYRNHLTNRIRLGAGIVGQAALEKQPLVFTEIPPDHVVTTGLLETPLRQLMVAPFLYEERVIGVVELGTVQAFTPEHLRLIKGALENIAIAINTAQSRARIDELLAETRQQAEELQAREERLRAANAELERQTESLSRSETQLREQQAELAAANRDLEETTMTLREQQAVLDRQNRDLKVAQQELRRRAEALAQASRYKSEFLANMSHELRTPLNSLLILAQMLARNEEGNLTEDQIESATIIYDSGSDLLKLINDILDLSKVEAGKMSFHLETVAPQAFADAMRDQFTPLAKNQNLDFEIHIADNTPATLTTDRQRVEQIIKNLLANAFKFTDKGRISLTIEAAPPSSGYAIAMHIRDTGIGMTQEQQDIVFEAFQQADGSTSRRYGGTGLGLAISRELATHLGGNLTLQSQYGEGSTFTLMLPDKPREPVAAGAVVTPSDIPQSTEPIEAPDAGKPELLTPAHAGADRDKQTLPSGVEREGGPSRQQHPRPMPSSGDKTLLIIEDDANFADILCNYAQTQGFLCQIAGDGESGWRLAKRHHPAAVLLDLTLPGMSGWDVLERLKHDLDTRHIPVHIISGEAENLNAYQMGAMGFLTKPVDQQDLENAFERIVRFIDREIKTLLVVEDDVALRRSVRQLLSADDVRILEAGTGQAALAYLATTPPDCIILDLSLPDMSGFNLLNRIHNDPTLPQCPVIIYTGRELTEEENLELMQYTDSVIVKGVKSPERLLDETALFLHQLVSDLSRDKQHTLQKLQGEQSFLKEKRVLVVDDDMRNAFALSKLLGDKGLKVTIAPNGVKALEFLQAQPAGFDIILMDIMMPEMDGYDTIEHIRRDRRFRDLPILALTAKAMKGDAEKCIAAGANDYLSKPVNVDRLFSMLRVWLYP